MELTNRGQIISAAIRQFRSGHFLKGVLIMMWIMVPLRLAKARFEYIKAKKPKSINSVDSDLKD